MTEGLEPVVEAIVLTWGSSRRSHAHMLRVGDGPPSLPGLDRLIFTPQAPFEAAITLGPLFITFFLFLFAKSV